MTQDKTVILIIEDSLTEQIALKRMFIDEGYNVICASSGEEGVEKAESEKRSRQYKIDRDNGIKSTVIQLDPDCEKYRKLATKEVKSE